jgi:hydrogenase expression/formation protein HypC
VTPSPCDGPVCITCADEAVRVTVVELLDADLARVDTGVGIETVSVALVDAAPGDVVLVHAGEAIAALGADGAGPVAGHTPSLGPP